MTFGSALFTASSPANSSSGGSALLSLKEELARKKLIPSPSSKQKETVENRPTNTGAISRLRPDSARKTEKDTAPDSKYNVPLRTPDLKIPESVKPKETKEESKTSQIFSSLAQELEKIRGESLLTTSSPKSNVLDRIGSLTKTLGTNSTQEDKSEKDPETPLEKYQSRKAEIRRASLTETISLKRLYEMQDILNDVSEKEFNELPSRYFYFPFVSN